MARVQLDDQALALGLQWYVENMDSVNRLCNKLCRRVACGRRRECFEIARDEAIRTIPMAMRTYDETRNVTMRTHVLGNVRWYIWKKLVATYVGNKNQHPEKHVAISYEEALKERDKRMADARLLGGAQFARCGEREATIRDDSERQLASRDQVQYVMARVTDFDRQLLQWYFIDRLTIDEIAELLYCVKSTVSRSLQEAIASARSILVGDLRSA